MAIAKSRAPVPVWKGAEYMRVSEGRYRAVAKRFQGPTLIRQYSRWSLLVEFELLDDGSRVCAFYNLGTGRDPTPARQGRYFKAWTLANGELPRKGQPMVADVFLEGQIYTVEIRDNRKTAKESDKCDSEIYSVVEEIVCVERSTLIKNQLIKNHESHDQPIKQSTNQVGYYPASIESDLIGCEIAERKATC
jgi:hypothetical protein